MKRILAAVLTLALAGTAFAAKGDKERDRLKDSGEVLKEILDVPDDIPQPLLDKAGTAVTGTSLPAAVYRQFVGSALGTARTDIDRPELIGDPKAGNA